jgi:hypothetical protein
MVQTRTLVSCYNIQVTHFTFSHDLTYMHRKEGKQKESQCCCFRNLGLSKRGIARAKRLSPQARSTIARNASFARWHGEKY